MFTDRLNKYIREKQEYTLLYSRDLQEIHQKFDDIDYQLPKENNDHFTQPVFIPYLLIALFIAYTAQSMLSSYIYYCSYNIVKLLPNTK